MIGPVKLANGAALAAAALALAACGQSGPRAVPDVAHVPLVGGARVLASTRLCDKGSSAFCGVQLVVTDSRYGSSTGLMHSERQELEHRGWSISDGDITDEKAAESPGHKLRLTYATASTDLKGVDLGWIRRSRVVALALSHTMFARASTISLMLETGSA
jgi:hypothetical protein